MQMSILCKQAGTAISPHNQSLASIKEFPKSQNGEI